MNMRRVMTVVFLGVVLGVDSRLGYWDLVGGGEIRNMVIVVFIVIIIIITIIILDPIYTRHITMVLLYILRWFHYTYYDGFTIGTYYCGFRRWEAPVK